MLRTINVQNLKILLRKRTMNLTELTGDAEKEFRNSSERIRKISVASVGSAR